jgi:hypothetical protein
VRRPKISAQKFFANAARARDVARMARDETPCKTSSPAKPRASAGGSSREQKNDTLFNTITNDDWRRSVASARRQPNAVSEKIRTAISSRSAKTK